MKNKKIILGLVFFHLFGGGALYAQQRPNWTNAYYEKIGSCIYEKVEATGLTYEDAYKAARQKALENCAGRFGIAGHFSTEDHGSTFIIVQNGDKLAKINIIGSFPNAENFRSGGTVYLLVQEMDDCRKDFPDAQYKTTYPASARILIPGWEQFYKGQSTKGTLFLVGEAVCVGGVIVAQTCKVHNETLMSGTYTSMRQTYADRANLWNTVSIGCGIAAGILYVWNIADGLFSEGEGRVFLCDASFNITPYVTPQSSGLALCLKF